MIDSSKCSIFGHIKIEDKTNNEVLVDKDNAIHVGNISTKLAEAFIGKPWSFISYMAFGNGGVTIDGSGQITYNNPNVSQTKVPSAQLYNTTYIKEIKNYNSYNGNQSDLDATTGGGVNNYEDITIVVTLNENEPSPQRVYDDANVVGQNPISNTDFVFNEIALYTGLPNKGTIDNSGEINEFVNGMHSDDNADSRPTMVTHVIFHPVQKSLNREIEITYVLRIEMDS